MDGIDYKYGHPDPLLSNGGVMAEVLEFVDALDEKPDQFVIDDFMDETALNFVRTIESKAVNYEKSTGFFGRWAALNGPTAIDCFTVLNIKNSLHPSIYSTCFRNKIKTKPKNTDLDQPTQASLLTPRSLTRRTALILKFKCQFTDLCPEK